MYTLFSRIDLPLDPVGATACLQSQAHVVLLHSGMRIGDYGDYSFLACDPFLTVRAKGRDVRLTGARSESLDANPFDVVHSLMDEFSMPPAQAPFPFVGGAVGYFGYDLGWHLEDLPRTTVDDVRAPDMCIGFYDAVLAFCHKTGEVYSCGVDRLSTEAASEKAGALWEKVRSGRQPHRPDTPTSDGTLLCNFTKPEYIEALTRTIDYIYAGDIFQANISQRFETSLRVSPWELYCRLHERSPAPFAAYLDFDDVTVVCGSPERFMKVVDGHVQTRPIKGTRPRGASADEDRALARELRESEKDGAELTMIVDLERNDLGRVCRFGSVTVPELAELESYPAVHHLVATVLGELLPDKSNIDLLRASFPGGSITGAPKIRAMEIIDELEPTHRGIYTGNIGYLGFDGTMDLNIVIRTIVVRDGRAHFQVGGGIVADSDPELEWQETLDKGRGLAMALDAQLEA